MFLFDTEYGFIDVNDVETLSNPYSELIINPPNEEVSNEPMPLMYEEQLKQALSPIDNQMVNHKTPRLSRYQKNESTINAGLQLMAPVGDSIIPGLGSITALAGPLVLSMWPKVKESWNKVRSLFSRSYRKKRKRRKRQKQLRQQEQIKQQQAIEDYKNKVISYFSTLSNDNKKVWSQRFQMNSQYFFRLLLPLDDLNKNKERINEIAKYVGKDNLTKEEYEILYPYSPPAQSNLVDPSLQFNESGESNYENNYNAFTI